MKIDFGTVVSPFAIEKLVMAKDQKVRAAIISMKIRYVKLHYVENMGYFHCFGGSCDDEMGIPSVRYMFPLLIYPCDFKGVLSVPKDEIKPDQIAVKILAVGQEDYQNLLTKDQLRKDDGSSLVETDLLISCTDTEYQRKSYDIAGQALWRDIIDKEYYKSQMTIFHTKGEQTMGRVFDEEKYRKAMNFVQISEPVKDRPALGSVPEPTKQIEQDVDVKNLFEEDDDIPF